jgi:predicted AAA+ superfamily ATPase
LDEALRFGLLPIVWDSTAKDETLAAYAQLYLKEEIQAEALVRNLPGFARFLPIAAVFHGQIINVTSIARDAGVARTTVTGYLDILEETLLCFRLPAYEAKLRVRERKTPKWYWCDPGMVRAMKRSSGAVTQEERGDCSKESWRNFSGHTKITGAFAMRFITGPLRPEQKPKWISCCFEEKN